MAAQLSRPGVEVIQTFKAVSPTIITPTLVPNVTGVCKQVVEVLVSDGSGGSVLNSQAVIDLPGFALAKAATGTPPKYTGLDGLALVFQVNSSPDITVTFSDPGSVGLTPAGVVAQVQAAMTAAGVTAAVAEAVGTTQWQLRTVGLGQFQSILIKSTSGAAVLTAFGFGGGKTYAGLDAYNQFIVEIPQEAFPNPRSNLGELAIETDTIRVFLATGNGAGLQEARRTAAFCMNGTVNDAPGISGTVVLSTLVYPAGVAGLTIRAYVDSNAPTLHTVGSPANVAAFIAGLNATFNPVGITASTDFFGHLQLVSNTPGGNHSITVVAGGTLLAVVGITAGTSVGQSIAAVDDGNGDAVTPMIQFHTGFFADNFTLAETAAVMGPVTGTYPLAGNYTLELSDGNQPQTIQLTTGMTVAQVVAAINAVVSPAAGGYITASTPGAGQLTLTHSLLGTDSVIDIIGGSALTPLGMAIGFTRGQASRPKPGDELWIDGVFYANIAEVAPSGVTSVLKIDKQVTISTNIGANWYIIAKNLTATPVSNRPYPELRISAAGSAIVKQEMLRDTSGNRIASTASIYLAYDAVRKDVTSTAAKPGLLRFDDTTQLSSALSPLDTSNPLGLGLYFALLNAPGIQVTGLGVDAISADSPYGTVEAFTRAAEFLEAHEIYAIAPLTHDETVHQVFDTHVTVMSQPENKGERVVLINPSMPTVKRDTLVASGKGDGISTTVFDTHVNSLSGLVLAAGINPVGTLATASGLFLDIAADSKRYSIQSISGSQVTIRTTFAVGENEDGFYSTTALPATLIAESFSVKIRGAKLTNVDGTPDNTGIAETIQALGQAYGNRRVWMIVPDTCSATIGGLEQSIEGFYLCAAIAGMVGQQPPQQSFTNFPMTGFTGVKGSNNRFSQTQMNIMAAGGANIIVQDAPGGPLTSQFALTTDLTSVETRTDSITKVVDFTAKFLRRGIRNFIGRFNITQGLLDTLSSVIHGLLGFLVENGVLIGADLNNIIQDEDNPDTVLVEVRIDVPYPCNFIKLTIQV